MKGKIDRESDRADFSQLLLDSVQSYVTWYRQLLRRYESAVKRAPGTGDVCTAFPTYLHVVQWYQASVRHTSTTRKPPVTIEESVDHARGIEAGNVTDDFVSSVASSHIAAPHLKQSRKRDKKHKTPASDRPNTFS